MKIRVFLSGLFLLLGLVQASFGQADALTIETSSPGGQVARLVVTTSTATEHAEVRIENAILRLSTTGTGSNPQGGDLDYGAGVVKYYNGSSWIPLPSGGGGTVLLGPAATQTDGGGGSLIHLRESGGSAPSFINLKVSWSTRFEVSNTGNVSVPGGLFTDRWTLSDTNTLIGVGVAGAGNLASTGITAVGYQALYSITTGTENTAAGCQAMYATTNGSGNTAVGARALYSNTSGSCNCAMGVEALYSSTASDHNAAFGRRALYNLDGGTRNVAVGDQAGFNFTTGSDNVAIGSGADMYNQAGSNNVAIGCRAGYGGGSTHSKSGCVFIGYEAGYNETSSNRLYIESSTYAPYIYGEFDNKLLRVSATLEAVKASGTVAILDRKTDDGTVVSIQRDGVEQGTISVSGATVSYNPFTGSHLGLVGGSPSRGTLLSMTGRPHHHNPRAGGEPIYDLHVTGRANDPAVLGAYLSPLEPGKPVSPANPHLVMSVGNGVLQVVDTVRDIEPGDRLVSSEVPGCAMVDPGTFGKTHVVARAAQALRWEEVEGGGEGPKCATIQVLLERSILRGSPDDAIRSLEGRLRRQDETIARLESLLEVLESEESTR